MPHLQGRVIANGSTGCREPPDEVDVLAITQRLVEATAVGERLTPNDQHSGGRIRDALRRSDGTRTRAEIERRPVGGDYAEKSAPRLASAYPRCSSGYRRVLEV